LLSPAAAARCQCEAIGCEKWANDRVGERRLCRLHARYAGIEIPTLERRDRQRVERIHAAGPRGGRPAPRRAHQPRTVVDGAVVLESVWDGCSSLLEFMARGR
jgi:hypothetical protein